jgi:hypothetical protein
MTVTRNAVWCVFKQVRALGLRLSWRVVQDSMQFAAVVFPSGGARFVSAPPALFPLVIIPRWAPAVPGSPGWSVPDVQELSHGRHGVCAGAPVNAELHPPTPR